MRFAIWGNVPAELEGFAEGLADALAARGYERLSEPGDARLVLNFIDRSDPRPYRRENKWTFVASFWPETSVPDPFVPYTVLAVELEHEQMIVLGPLVPDADPSTLQAGTEVELTLGTLYEDDDHEYVIWQWKPVNA